MAMLNPDVLELLKKAERLEKFALAQLVSIFERSDEKSHRLRQQIIDKLGNITTKSQGKRAAIVGISGTPGAGKSTLLGRLAIKILESQPNLSVCVLAIDPSSHESGGSLLGDRTRTQFPLKERRIYFRSQASELALGGIGKSTFSVTNLLSHFFDLIFIETVGIGQTEIEIRHLADYIYLVMQPFAGDQIQFMKAGIMEIPDVFIINKCDEEKLANQSFYQLKSSLQFLNPLGDEKEVPPIFLTSASQSKGITELARYISKSTSSAKPNYQQRQVYFLKKAIERTFGSWGIQQLNKLHFFNNLGYNFETNYQDALEIISKFTIQEK